MRLKGRCDAGLMRLTVLVPGAKRETLWLGSADSCAELTLISSSGERRVFREVPLQPELVIDTTELSLEESVEQLLRLLE